MTRERAIEELKKQQSNLDIEEAHIEADGVLGDLLKTLGYEDVVEEFLKVNKWYS